MSRFAELSARLHYDAVRDRAPRFVVDVGCGDGRRAVAVGARRMLGLDGDGHACAVARASGMTVVQTDLEGCWPVADGCADVVSSNQVIEHMAEPDHFVRECARILRPGGAAVNSTENLAAWPNIAVLLLGQEPFSNSYSKERWGVGNRLSRRSGRQAADGDALYPHRSVGSFQALCDLFALNGLRHAGALGVHTLPLPVRVLRALRRIDVRHAMYITLVLEKS